MRSLLLVWTLVFAVSGCRVATSVKPPPPSQEARDAMPIEWAKRDPQASILPGSANPVQIVITSGRDGENYVWLVQDGRKVLSVYRTSAAETEEFLALTAKEIPKQPAGFSFGIWGASAKAYIIRPPPPPPPPGHPPFFSLKYVKYVMEIAWRIQELVQKPASEIVEPGLFGKPQQAAQ